MVTFVVVRKHFVSASVSVDFMIITRFIPASDFVCSDKHPFLVLDRSKSFRIDS